MVAEARVRWWVLGLVACAGPPTGQVDSTTRPAVGPQVAPPPPWSPPTTDPVAHSAWDHTGRPEVVEMAGFSFVDDSLAGMPQPYADDVPFLAEQGLALLISAREVPMDPALLAPYGIDGLHLPIEDFTAPTLEQQRQFVAEVRGRRALGERVGVHCLAGLGRTGTLLATWFVAEGYAPQAAIDHVRALRPGSIETAEQEAAVFGYAEAEAP